MKKDLTPNQEILKQQVSSPGTTNAAGGGNKPPSGNTEQGDEENEQRKMFEVEKIEGTPFNIVTMNEEEEEFNSFLAIGNSRISEKASKGKLKMRVVDKDWELLTQVIVHLAKKVIDNKALLDAMAAIKEN